MSKKRLEDENVRGPERKRRQPSDDRKSDHWTKEEMDRAEPYPLPEIDEEDKDKKKKQDQ